MTDAAHELFAIAGAATRLADRVQSRRFNDITDGIAEFQRLRLRALALLDGMMDDGPERAEIEAIDPPGFDVLETALRPENKRAFVAQLASEIGGMGRPLRAAASRLLSSGRLLAGLHSSSPVK